MKLSSETVVGLKRLCNPSLIPENHFHHIVNDGNEAILNNKTTAKRIPDDLKLDVMKSAYASLTILLTEAARYSLDSAMFKNILEGYNLNQTRIAYIVEMYDKYKSSVQSKLTSVGTAPPHIVAVHWRLDYSLKSNCNQQTLGPAFHIKFVTKISNNEEKIIRFVCSIQNLEELIYVLKGAVRHMNKLVANTLK